MNEPTNTTDGEVKPLTDWKNAPTLQALKADLMDAKLVHEVTREKISRWLDNLNVSGTAKMKPVAGNSSIQPKLIRKQAEWRYASLSEPFLSTANVFSVKPKTWEDRAAAQQNQLLLNHQFNTAIDKVRFIDEYVRSAVDEGTVIVRTGWCFEEIEEEVEVPDVQFVINPELAPLHAHLQQLKEESPSEYAEVPDELKQACEMSIEQGQPIEAVIVGKKMEKRMRTVRNHPTAEVCDYNNVIFDPTCMGNVDKAQFVIYSFESNKATLQKDKRYKNLDKIRVEANSVLAQPDHAPDGGATNFSFNDEPRKKFVVYEYWGFWDIAGDGKVEPILVSWVGDQVVRMEMNPFPDKKIPFVVEQYLPVRRATYGEPDGALLEDNQKVIGAVTRGMIDLMGKSASGQTGIRKDMLDVTNRRKFDKGQDYEFNPNVDPRQGVHMHVFPEIPQSAQFMLQLQNFEAESLTGVKSYSQGVSGAALGDVAAGVRGALDAASKRELGILRRLSNGVVKLGRKFMSMNSEFLSDEEVVRVTNDQFVAVRKNDLAGEFDLELSISTAEEDNNKAEQLAFLLQTTGNNMDPDLRNMLLADIARLRKMPDMAHKIEAYKPEPDPLMQRKMQLEIALLEAQVANEQAKSVVGQTQAVLNQAKAGTEGAKAGNIKSVTDKTNLDYVEQETGVTQERAKELHGEQARAQGQLKLLEADLTRSENAKDRDHDLLKEYVKARQKKLAK